MTNRDKVFFKLLLLACITSGWMGYGIFMTGKRNRNEERLACKEFEQAITTQVTQPAMYRVWLYTSQSARLGVLVDIIRTVFYYDSRKAHELAIESIDNGKALCCVLPRDVAETKAEEIHELSAVHSNEVSCMLQKGCVYVVKKN